MPKSGAQRSREYRERQRVKEKMPRKIAKSAAQRAREYRARKKLLNVNPSAADPLQNYELATDNYMLWKFTNGSLFLNEGLVPHGFRCPSGDSLSATEETSSGEIDELEEPTTSESEGDVKASTPTYETVPLASEDPLKSVTEVEDIKPNNEHKTFTNKSDAEPLNDQGVGLLPRDLDLEKLVTIKEEIKEELDIEDHIVSNIFKDASGPRGDKNGDIEIIKEDPTEWNKCPGSY